MTFELKLDALSEMIREGKLYLSKIYSRRHSADVIAEQSLVGVAIIYLVKSQVAVNMYLWPSELGGLIGPTKSMYVWSKRISPRLEICMGTFVFVVTFVF